jgi:oxygen-independent coproporphyrinogen-3 oxidase
MGVTAISGIQNAYAQNHRDLASWERAVRQRGLATMRGYHLSHDDRLRRAVISRLLCHTVVMKEEISREFEIDFDQYFAKELQQLEPPREDGLVLVERDEIRATWLGRIFIRNIAMIFDPYLEKQQLASKPLFSRTL